MRIFGSPDVGSYSYTWVGYANPDAVTQIANGVSTTTYTYDNNGNLTQKTTDGVTTTLCLRLRHPFLRAYPSVVESEGIPNV